MYKQALQFLRKAIDFLGLGDEEYNVLKEPERVIEVSIPLKRDNGSIIVLKAWRSQHNSALGPYKGGVRYHPNVTREEVIALSMIMTWKNSLAELPYGGGKGGVRVNPKELSTRELEQLSRKYIRAIARYIGPDIDIPAPDVYTDPQVMAWFYDEYSKVNCGLNTPAVVTGKPTLLGGIEVRKYSTGYGVALITKLAAEKLYGSIVGRTVAIQGFGKVGKSAAKTLYEWGARIVAVCDTSGMIYDKNGLDVHKLLKVKERTGRVVDYDNVARSDSDKILEVEADILIPAAIENAITMENAGRVKAGIIVEGANSPVTTEAEEILTKRNIIVIPDIMANAGGVVASFLEWANNRAGMIFDDKTLLRELESRMTRIFRKCWSKWELESRGETLRTIAYSIAVERVLNAMKLRGMI